MFYVGNAQRTVSGVFKSKNEVYLDKFYERLTKNHSSLQRFVLGNGLVGSECDYAKRIDAIWQSGYAREQVLFVKTETMTDHVDKVYAFLGLPDVPLKESDSRVFNKGHYSQKMSAEIDQYLMEVLLKPCVDRMKARVPHEITADWDINYTAVTTTDHAATRRRLT